MQATSNGTNMRYKIADLITEIPTAGGFASRCGDYIWDGDECTDITIRSELYDRKKYIPEIDEELFIYMESARQFYSYLLAYDGFYLHSSAVVKDGKAYLFSGPSGIGKSTHTGLWKLLPGDESRVINDDKPALRYVNDKWYVYGTPWCGKDGININEKAPLAGVCFLKRGDENKIRRMSKFEAMQRVLGQTIYKLNNEEQLDKLIKSLESFLDKIPVYELENLPEVAAAKLSYETMSRGAEEAGL